MIYRYVPNNENYTASAQRATLIKDFSEIFDCLLEHFNKTFRRPGEDKPTFSKEQIIGLYQAAATIYNARMIVVCSD